METAISPRFAVSDSNITALQKKISGKILVPGDAIYDTVRKIWNGMIDRRPALIIQCDNAYDVTESVKFAKANNLVIAVRGGGHNVTGNAVCDDGIMIDLSNMKRISVDPVQRTANAEMGATWAEFDKATQEFGLATTGGVISTTGIAGLTLGGGVGWLVRHYGMSCDNVISAEVVTAEGELILASEGVNADLLWGLKGGGGNFGIVTSLTYQLHPVSTVIGGMILHPMDDAKKMLRFYCDFMKTAPDELTMYAGILHTPDGLQVVAMVGCYSGDIEKGEEVLKPIREFGSPIADLFQPQPYLQLQTMLEGPFPHGNRFYWKSGFLQDVTDAAIDAIISHSRIVTSPISAILLEFYGGAASRISPTATAFPHRQEEFDLVIISNWTDPNEDERHISWTRNFWSAMQDYSSNCVYVNALGVEGEQRVREAYGVNYNRLMELKKKYDPQNIFRMNQNINPNL